MEDKLNKPQGNHLEHSERHTAESEWGSEEQRALELLDEYSRAIERYRRSSWGSPAEQRALDQIGEFRSQVASMGVPGLRAVLRACADEMINTLDAHEFIGQFDQQNSDQERIPTETFLGVIGPAFTRGEAPVSAIGLLGFAPAQEALPYIQQYIQHKADELEQLLADQDVESVLGYGPARKRAQVILDDIRETINVIQSDEDLGIGALRSAQELFEKVEPIQQALIERERRERERLLGSLNIDNLDPFAELELEELSPKEKEEVDVLFERIEDIPLFAFPLGREDLEYGGQRSVQTLRDFLDVGQRIIPYMTERVHAGALDMGVVMRLLRLFPEGEGVAGYKALLLYGVGILDEATGLDMEKMSEDKEDIAPFIAAHAYNILQSINDEVAGIGGVMLHQRMPYRNGVIRSIEFLGQLDQSHLVAALREAFPAAIAEVEAEHVFRAYTGDVIEPIKSPEEVEKKEWRHTGMEVVGDALYAALAGKGKQRVKRVDIQLNTDFRISSKTIEVDDIEDIAHLLEPQEKEQLSAWLERNDYEELPLRLVRNPEMHPGRIATNEPRLFLWKSGLEDKEAFRGWTFANGIGESRAHDSDFDAYRSGEGLLLRDLPEQLEPRASLASAFEAVYLSKHFGIEFEDSFLQQAEDAARKEQLIISVNDTPAFGYRHEGDEATVLGPSAVEVFASRKIRKALMQQGFQRLGQVAQMVAGHGDPEAFIREEYGEAYLRTRGYVQLYDAKLIDSPASLERQMEFIRTWNERMDEKAFEVAEVEKVDDSMTLIRPKNLEELIDRDRFERFAKERGEKPNILKKVAGTYRLELSGETQAQLREKIELFLEVMNVDWPEGLDFESGKVTKTLIKLGMPRRNPMLADFDSKSEHEARLVISTDPKDMMHASTGKPWTSCTKLDDGGGMYSSGLYGDVGAGTAVAYVLEGKKYVGRKLLRIGRTLDTFEPAVAIEKFYGDGRYEQALADALRTAMSHGNVRTDVPMITHQFDSNYKPYADSSVQTAENAYLYYT